MHFSRYIRKIIESLGRYTLISIKLITDETYHLRPVIRDFFLRMYKPVKKSDVLGEQMISSYGFAGILIDLVLVGLPLLMV